MKRNAFIRIILWSATIVLLLGIMLTAMGLRQNRLSVRPAETLQEAIWVTTPEPVDTAAKERTLSQDTVLYSSPDTSATELDTFGAGSTILITREERVSGKTWAFVTSPESGWILLDNAVSVDLLPSETMVSAYTDLSKDTFSPADIREIEIEWAAGEILIQPGNGDVITVEEDGVTEEKYAMVLRQENRTLKIQFCKDETYSFFGIHTTSIPSKDLTITVPRDWVCESLEIDAASATVEVNDLYIREVDFDGASGVCEFENCVVDEIDLDTASGDIRFVGELSILDCDSASAKIYAVINSIPSRIDINTMSGDVDLTLPESAGFSLAMDTMNGDFNSEFETTLKNGNYVCGDGHCRINVDAMSGDVTIRKGQPMVGEVFAEEAIVPQHHEEHHEHTSKCETDPDSCPDYASTAPTVP